MPHFRPIGLAAALTLAPLAAAAAPLASYDGASSAALSFTSFVFTGSGLPAAEGVDYELSGFTADGGFPTSIATGNAERAGFYGFGDTTVGAGSDGWADSPEGYSEFYAYVSIENYLVNLTADAITVGFSYMIDVAASAVATAGPPLNGSYSYAGAGISLETDQDAIIDKFIDVLVFGSDSGTDRVSDSGLFVLGGLSEASILMEADADGFAYVEPVPIGPALPLLAGALGGALGGLALLRRRG